MHLIRGAGGVLDKAGKLVKESVIYDLINDSNQKQFLAFGHAYHVTTIRKDSRKVIYLGLAHQHWGHFLVDVVQRLWYVIENEQKILSGDLKDYLFVFSGFGDGITHFDRNYEEFFRLFGLNMDRILIVEKPTEFSEVIVPDISIYPGQYIYCVYKKIFERVSNSALEIAKEKNLPIYDKIYFSRLHLKDNKEMGEISIQKALEKCGYKILYPEELNLVEQIWFWRTAKEIACINGSITHNVVFAKPTLSLYVFNKMSRVIGYQFTMDAVWGNTPVYISAYKEPFANYPISVSRGPFWITITNEVKKFLIEKYGQYEKSDENRVMAKYIYLCIISRLKYMFKGSKSKIKSFLK